MRKKENEGRNRRCQSEILSREKENDVREKKARYTAIPVRFGWAVPVRLLIVTEQWTNQLTN